MRRRNCDVGRRWRSRIFDVKSSMGEDFVQKLAAEYASEAVLSQSHLVFIRWFATEIVISNLALP